MSIQEREKLGKYNLDFIVIFNQNASILFHYFFKKFGESAESEFLNFIEKSYKNFHRRYFLDEQECSLWFYESAGIHIEKNSEINKPNDIPDFQIPSTLKHAINQLLSTLVVKQESFAIIQNNRAFGFLPGNYKIQKILLSGLVFFLICIITLGGYWFLYYYQFNPVPLNALSKLEKIGPRKWQAKFQRINNKEYAKQKAMLFINPWLILYGDKSTFEFSYKRGMLRLNQISGQLYLLNQKEQNYSPLLKKIRKNSNKTALPQNSAKTKTFDWEYKNNKIKIDPIGTAMILSPENGQIMLKSGIAKINIQAKNTNSKTKNKQYTLVENQIIKLKKNSSDKIEILSVKEEQLPDAEQFIEMDTPVVISKNASKPDIKQKNVQKNDANSYTKIILNNGNILYGKVIDKNSQSVTIKTKYGTQQIPINSIINKEKLFKKNEN